MASLHALHAGAPRPALRSVFGEALDPSPPGAAPPAVVGISSGNALAFRLPADPAAAGGQGAVAGEGAAGAGRAPGTVGPEELRAELLAAGAQERFLPQAWVDNHYRWIVWKLAAYERRHPARFAGAALTHANVLEQLKYRWGARWDRNGGCVGAAKLVEMILTGVDSYNASHVAESPVSRAAIAGAPPFGARRVLELGFVGFSALKHI